MENSTREAQKLALIAEITAVFDGVERGDGTTFYEGTALDDGGFPDKVEKARARDTESRWQDVPDKTFRDNYSALSFLDPKGFRYYIPALMIWYLRHVDIPGPDFESNGFDSIIVHLTLSTRPSTAEYLLGRYQALQPQEAKAVASFLAFDSYQTQKLITEERALQEPEMLAEGLSNEEVEAYWEDYRSRDDARVALDKYWGQFL